MESLRTTIRTAIEEDQEEEEAVMPPPMPRPGASHGRNFHSSTDRLRVLLGELETLVQDPSMTPEGVDLSDRVDSLIDVVEFMDLNARNARLGAGLKVLEAEVVSEVEQVYAKAVSDLEEMRLRLRHSRPQEVLSEIVDEIGKLMEFIIPPDYNYIREPTTTVSDDDVKESPAAEEEEEEDPAEVSAASKPAAEEEAAAPAAEPAPKKDPSPPPPPPAAELVQVYKPVRNVAAWNEPKDAPMWRKRWWRFQLLSKIALMMKAAQKKANEAKRDGFWSTIEKRIETMLLEEARQTEQKVATAKGEAIEEAVEQSASCVQGKVDRIGVRMDALEEGRKEIQETTVKNTRTADMAMNTAQKALKVADRALKGGGGGGPPAPGPPVEEMIVHQGPIEGSGPSTAQIMEHVKVRVIDLVNEHIGDKFATDRRLEEAMRCVEAMPEIEIELREVKSLCREAIESQKDLYDSKVDVATLQSHQEAFAAGQEQLSQHFSDDISSVLGKLQGVSGGFQVLHDSISDLVAAKADRGELEVIKRLLREQDSNRVASPLSVKCLSCHQTLPIDPVKTPGGSLPVGALPEPRPNLTVERMRDRSPPRQLIASAGRPGSALTSSFGGQSSNLSLRPHSAVGTPSTMRRSQMKAASRSYNQNRPHSAMGGGMGSEEGRPHSAMADQNRPPEGHSYDAHHQQHGGTGPVYDTAPHHGQGGSYHNDQGSVTTENGGSERLPSLRGGDDDENIYEFGSDIHTPVVQMQQTTPARGGSSRGLGGRLPSASSARRFARKESGLEFLDPEGIVSTPAVVQHRPKTALLRGNR